MGKSYLAKKDAPKTSDANLCEYWLEEVRLARKRESKWLKAAYSAVEIYEGETETAFNILYANTETLSPAIYNSTPRPDVATRYKREDLPAVAAAGLCQSYLSFFVDSGDPRYSSFDELMVQAILHGTVPGRGCIWFKYDADIETDESGSPAKVNYEAVCGEMVPFDRLLEGYGRTWQQVPWIARIHVYSKEEAERDFKEKASLITFSTREEGESRSDSGDAAPEIKDACGANLGIVYEIWDKANRRVLFITPGADKPVKVTPDPLKLEGFFPTPEPFKLFRRVSSNTPKTLYSIYENQARELNRVTTRIQRIIEALKVRGFYDQRVDSISKALQAEDNVLLPAENVAAMMGMGGKLEDAIYTFPIEKLVNVLQQLYQQREQIKQIIYEVTGISDILRGASVASETATAQNLKDQWGSLRLKRMQKEVARYVRDCLRIVAEIAFDKLSLDTLASVTGTKLPRKADQEKAKQLLAQMQQMGQQPDPSIEQMLAIPSLEDVHGLLKSDLLRRYNVDIEANSTVDAEATEDKADIAEFMQAMGGFFAGISPLVENGTLPFDAAKAMLLAIVKRYRFGREVEEQIRLMTKPSQPSAEDLKKMQADLDAKAKEIEQQEAGLKDQLTKVEDEKRNVETLRKEFAAELKVAQAEEKARLAAENAQRQTEEAVFQAKQTMASAEQDTKHQGMVSGLEQILGKIEEAAAAATATPEKGDDKVLSEVQSALAGLEERLTSAVKSAGTQKVRASRQPDGSWVREPVQE